MQDFDWNDLRYLLALHRAGTLSAAARRLGVNETTVARRLKRLEQALCNPLFTRSGQAPPTLTDTGRTALRHAERIESEALECAATLAETRQQLSGVVRITSVPVLVNRVLVPHLPDLHRDHPHLTIELIPDPRNLALTEREADLALRLARPANGGLKVTARRLGNLQYAAYGPSTPNAALPWITFEDGHSHLPQAAWLVQAAGSARAGLRIADADTAVEAVAAGLGHCLLPVIVGDADPRLQRIAAKGTEPPVRPLWLLSHRDQAGLAAVKAVTAWINGIDWSGKHI
jgi:DNA-binding transcriptional LysR family regulator